MRPDVIVIGSAATLTGTVNAVTVPSAAANLEAVMFFSPLLRAPMPLHVASCPT
jgi:hypothetical protein